MYSCICEIQTNSISFSFKNYWTIIYESLFPNNKEKAKTFIKKCFKNKLHETFLIDTKVFLHESLKQYRDFSGLQYYTINAESSMKLGLDIQILTPIKANKFKHNYPKLRNHLNFEFLNEIVAEISEFEYNNAYFIKKVDNWIEKTIDEVYIERNLETHNNISNNLSLLKLRDDFLYISRTIMQTSFKYCRKETKSIDEIMEKI